MFTKLNTQEELKEKRDERGVKKNASIRVHEADMRLIMDEYGSLQAFIDERIEDKFHNIFDLI